MKAAGAIAIAVLVCSLSGCTRSNVPPVAAAPAQPAVAATPPPAVPAPEVFTATAPLVTENQVELASQRAGVVAQVLVEVGQHVKKGQLLARLDDRQLRAELESQQAKAASIDADLKNWSALVKVAEADERRADGMWEAQLITKEALDHAKYKTVASRYEAEREGENLRHAQQAAVALDLELAKTRIVAPFDGVVARRYVRTGQKVADNDRLFWLVGGTPLKVHFMLPERMLERVRVGSSVQLAAVALPEQKAEATIVALSPVVDPGTGTLEAIAQLQHPAPQMRLGMTVQLSIPAR
jgi:RND family efflux transporter MFP subunit